MNTQSDQPNRYAAPQAEVEDVKDDTEVGELAGRGERLGAALLDGLLWGFAVWIPLFFGIFANGMDGLKSFTDSANTANPFSIFMAFGKLFTGTAGLLLIIGVLIVGGINLYFVAKNSQSIGKKLVGLKVVRTDGSKATLARIFWMRNVVNFLPRLIPFVANLYSLVDSLFIFGEQRRCIHDHIADTIVVKA